MASWDDFQNALIVRMDEPNTRLALPKDFNKSRFALNAVAFLKGANSAVMECGQQQIISCLMQGATLGLDFMAKDCYAVPYKGKLEFMTSPTGDIKLVKKYSKRPVKEIDAKLVREGDAFEVTYNDGEPSWVFKPKPFSDAPIIGGFAWVEYEDGGKLLDTLTRAELDAARSQSRASNSPAWTKFTNEMFRKVCIHRICKKVTKEFENPTQQEIFDDGTAIVTDDRELRDKDIVEEANSQEFTA